MLFKESPGRHLTWGLLVTLLAFPGWIGAAEKIDFVRQIKPILEAECISCHGATHPKGELRLDTREAAIKGGDSGTSLVPGQPNKSSLYTTTILAADHDELMPPRTKDGPMPKEKTELLRLWIEQGALWPEGLVLSIARKIDFAKDIKPILETSCLSCHREDHDKGDLRLDVKSEALKGGENGPAIVPGKPMASLLYLHTVLRPDHEALMPPKNKGGPLAPEQTELLREWIERGADWPEKMVLAPKAKEEGDTSTEDLENLKAIYQKIMANRDVTNSSQMKPYSVIIPGTDVKFDMLPIPAGEFVMGSPDKEAHHKADEAPPHKVAISPFWMGKCEVTWNEYELFMYPLEEKKIRNMFGYASSKDQVADAVTRPTTPYVEMSFGMGKEGFPAISMTQYAANTYCRWLSAKTGQYYRLPTEAEWEYACRAGTTTAYSFGDDPGKLGEYAWYNENSDFKYHKVGTKKPNPWGLYDMHGNVAEWTLDQYEAGYYKKFAGTLARDPLNVANTLYPRVVRGGSWDDDVAALRTAARRGSDKAWKMQDPQLPKSIWYLTDAQFLGFRIVRPLEVPPPEELSKYWTIKVIRD